MQHFHRFWVRFVNREGVILGVLWLSTDLYPKTGEQFSARNAAAVSRLPVAQTDLELAGHFESPTQIIEDKASRNAVDDSYYRPRACSPRPFRTNSRSSAISSGPWVKRAFKKPILTPVQPLGLCEA